MDGIIQIGPLMLASDRLLAVAALWLFLSAGAWIGTRTSSRAGRVAWIAVAIGILAARVAYVAENYTAFAAEPWTVIALWQGGFTIWPGVGAAAAAAALLLGRQRATGGLLVSLAALALAHMGLTHWLAPSIRPLPQGIVLADMNGKTLSLYSLRGQPFVLNLWATWCPPCRREMPMLIDVASGSKVPILLVNQRETPAVIAAYLKREKLATSALVLDPVGVLGEATGAQAFPTTLFVDAAGQIRSTHAGEISRAALTAAIRDLERNPI
ncbi:thiol-disulfide isomerase/thioredoxin [Hephaestia caeni]|uniref:Thiol-disulfide isomerase/thioredoxin n=1 Tax=Hephaestia caeni TaxID=645617 RepID=A0A397PN60_9SPHN|nr:TlpA disulfide reductase family protein [Hephaestia caeni]RIA47181.1 thiol-disulfide isomerase/thioredoxin [Hephaestia caeni]